jgi:hypothetical protein
MGASFNDSRSPINTMPWGGVYLAGRVFLRRQQNTKLAQIFSPTSTCSSSTVRLYSKLVSASIWTLHSAVPIRGLLLGRTNSDGMTGGSLATGEAAEEHLAALRARIILHSSIKCKTSALAWKWWQKGTFKATLRAAHLV